MDFFQALSHPKRHIHLNWTQVLISGSMILWRFSWPRIVFWRGFKPGITFSSSYTLLFPSKKLGACLGQVYKIINPLQDSRTKKILSSNLSLYYINTNEIPGELSRENLISSHVKITCYLHMWKYHLCYGYIINQATKRLLKWNGLVFHWCLYNK